MKAHASDRACTKVSKCSGTRISVLAFVFLESVNQNPHAVVPQLDTAIMECSGKQRLRRMECET
jgi:hypothetical protein